MTIRNIIYPSNIILGKKNFISILENHLAKDYNQCMRVFPKCSIRNVSYSNPTGTPGSGAGKGGGAGGSVRESGGGLGQFGAAQEEQFFYNKQREQLEKLKKKLKESKSGDLVHKEDK